MSEAQTAETSVSASKYGKGWKMDVPSSEDWRAAAFFGAPVRLPADADLRPWVSQVNDQGQTSTCVAQAITRALNIRLRRLNRPAPELSVLSIYVPARRREVGPDAKLEDGGCVPRDAMTSIKQLGVTTDEAWPFDLANLNSDLPWDILQAASKFLVFQWYRVDAQGASRSAAIAQAVSKGYPVVFGMNLWRAFEDYQSGVIASIGKDSAGGHMMCIVGYRTDASGKRTFLVLNSWGPWGEDGYCWIYEDVLASDRTSDFFAIEVQA